MSAPEVRTGDRVQWTESPTTVTPNVGVLVREGTVIGVLSTGEAAAVEVAGASSGRSWIVSVETERLTVIGGTMNVVAVVLATECQRCDAVYGIPTYLEDHPHFCPHGHRNVPPPTPAGDGG